MSEQKLGLLGLADLLGQGISEGAAAAERMHLAIADEAFAALDAVPGVSAVSKIVERTHHGIATLCYGAVATLGDTVSTLARNAMPETEADAPVAGTGTQGE